ncbi:MAG: DEAD/DEAH box helicase [Christensenella sp.]|uniref:DEAD/DEAH box helicase n=1 Tax=Christensenella sp. TaxID=1935934 RepID=UPI002B1F2102|nr:DEAD/DEAH box helicase [Christensenella sp.]MEA5004037.1 DEAD/DEAH box helicase [Christensenella sp.]
MVKTFGESLYEDIDHNEYLKELYNDILFNYSIALFRNNKSIPKDINLNHALRFADILSKSIHPMKSEKHKMWAQEIVALLDFLYPNDCRIRYYIGSILSSAGNYQGLELYKASFGGTDIWDQIYNEYIRELMKVPADSERYFFKSQRLIYNCLDRQYFSYSGPTSMGKSFIMRMFLKEHVLQKHQKNFAILVPTKALINEVSSKIIEDLTDNLSKYDYRLITSAGALSLQQKHNFIFILTPERLLYLLLDNPMINLDYLFIDEAHKISSKDSRSPFYYKVIDLIVRKNNNTHIIFSSPNIPNPGIYLKLIPQAQTDTVFDLATYYAPVSQTKYLVDLQDRSIRIYSEPNNAMLDVCSFRRDVTLSELIFLIGKNSQNIVYCNSTSKAVSGAREYAENCIKKYEPNSQIMSLVRDIKNEIHGDYYLAEVLEKGVAYHIGYLPSNIRMRIEELYKQGDIKTIFCTSTLVEGVNLPADNLFITSCRNGMSNMTAVDFKNLIGRVGRIEYNLYGNVFLVATNRQMDTKKYEELLEKEIPAQKLSLYSELTRPQKIKIIECLVAGNIELLRYPKSQSEDNYSLMRKFAIILLRDILSSNETSAVYKGFFDLLDEQKISKIKEMFHAQSQDDDDINISTDQINNLTVAIAKGLKYPDLNEHGQVDYNTLVSFLEKLSSIFKWDKYEVSTLGYRTKKTQQLGKLRWYAVILAQWMTGNGLNLIMNAAIEHKQQNPKSGVKIDGQIIEYNNSREHKNIVISSTLNAIEDVILFRIASYFLRFSLEYKKHHKIEKLQNDWYEYVEYGTTNLFTIFLQRNGFSRETSTYIKKHRCEFIVETEGDYRINNRILLCTNEGVRKEAEDIKYNIPELFID